MVKEDDYYYSECGRRNDMSYEKQNFVSGQILTAEMLNHMEADTVLARQ